MAGKKGMKIPSRSVSRARKERLSDNWRENIQASAIMKRLKDHGDGKLEKPLDATQIKAYEAILARTVPTLTSQELTHVNPEHSLTEEQILQKIQALISARPDLVAKAQAMNAKSQSEDGKPSIAVA